LIACCRGSINFVRGGTHAASNAVFKRSLMNNIVYIIGLIVIIVAILGFFGLR